MPAVLASSPAGKLLFGEKNTALGRAFGGQSHGLGIGGADSVIVMNLLARIGPENGALQRGCQHLRQQQVGDGAQLVARCRMSRNIDAQRSQLLDEPPHFRAAGPKLLGNLGAAGDDRRVADEQTDDPPQANVGRLVGRRQAASFAERGDGGNYKQSRVVGGWQNQLRGGAPETNSSRPAKNGRRNGQPIQSYAGDTRIPISIAVEGWVSAPTEIKSTPVSA